ncbi:DUF4114 domain-containing protein [Fulvivirgaceae bacterium PWU4]|uniref:DUF4114 domain-containing protein n=1 Tax=Chryseosolibacter histidini TaxID=2782349 RepID=A0AAP2DUQ0_9BACT|nr:DUF4114 domain-containing protein [Chryseosolibacter histidini]MBT1701009.1 DUF4114 domain-containing protein [Chryseosolibacter histidini]
MKEVPDDIISTKACPTLYGSIMEQFPEHKNNENKQDVLFDMRAKKQIVLLQESEVYVSFISEGAGFSNTFGWYAYDSAAAPSSTADIKLNVLFPVVSKNLLKQGDMLRLGDGKFKAGTVIGFFLIVGGWENKAVNYDKLTLYTDTQLNPNGQQQHILFKQKDCGDVVLAFEDRILNEGSDADFNDIIFTVTDNRENLDVATFDLRTVVKM